jgi:hypothetical protein
MIESFGYQAEIARDGTEALIKLKLDIDLYGVIFVPWQTYLMP